MAPKPIGRQAAKDVPNLVALQVVFDYQRGRGAFPLDALTEQGYLAKVAAAKLHKLINRGWVNDLALTAAGREILDGSDEAAVGADPAPAVAQDATLEYLKRRANG